MWTEHYWPAACYQLVSYVAHANVTDDYRRQRLLLVWPHTLCIGAPVIKQFYSSGAYNTVIKRWNSFRLISIFIFMLKNIDEANLFQPITLSRLAVLYLDLLRELALVVYSSGWPLTWKVREKSGKLTFVSSCNQYTSNTNRLSVKSVQYAQISSSSTQ